MINNWRQTIQLEPINMADGPSLMQKLKVPFTYCWSPSLVPKPDDWPSYIGEKTRARSTYLQDDLTMLTQS